MAPLRFFKDLQTEVGNALTIWLFDKAMDIPYMEVSSWENHL